MPGSSLETQASNDDAHSCTHKCSKCEQLVTQEIVHVTDDLKHDAHIAKVFTEKSTKIIQNNYVNICKIINFTDQAPSQYKNKTSFHYLANTKIPTQKNYFGVSHGKISCDACTGRVKKGVTRLVKNGDVVVNNAETFYDTCVKPMDTSDKCQHYMLTFELHRKICKDQVLRSGLEFQIHINCTKLETQGEKFCTFEISHVAALDAYMEQFLAKIIFAHQILQLLTWVQRNQLRLT